MIADAGDKPGTAPGEIWLDEQAGLPVRETQTGPAKAGGRKDAACDDDWPSTTKTSTYTLSKFGKAPKVVAPRHAMSPKQAVGSGGGDGGSTPCSVAGVEGVEEFTTERLVLRGWRASDHEALAAINADAEVMRWIGSGRVLGRGFSDDLIARFEGEWRERGFGLWAVSWRERRASASARVLRADDAGVPAGGAAGGGDRVAPGARRVGARGRDRGGAGGAGVRVRERGLREIVAVVAPENDAVAARRREARHDAAPGSLSSPARGGA